MEAIGAQDTLGDGRPTKGPLAGIRIVEFAGIGPGPFAAMLLADLGAEIVRIERPGETGGYQVLSRGRTTVTADLKDPAGRTAVHELLDRADALIEGYRPGVMERLGLGPDAVLARNPQIVYARMTGWGQDGPLAQTAGHDINYIAITGALDAIGPAERPFPPLNLVGDYAGGSLYLVAGLLAALLAVRSGAPGQVVDCAICDGAASLMAVFTELRTTGGWRDGRERNFLDGGAPYYGAFACADGEFIAFGAIEPQFYAVFRKLAGADDPVFDLRDDESAGPSCASAWRPCSRRGRVMNGGGCSRGPTPASRPSCRWGKRIDTPILRPGASSSRWRASSSLRPHRASR